MGGPAHRPLPPSAPPCLADHPEAAAAGTHAVQRGRRAAQRTAEVGVVHEEGGGLVALALEAGHQAPATAAREFPLVAVAHSAVGVPARAPTLESGDGPLDPNDAEGQGLPASQRVEHLPARALHGVHRAAEALLSQHTGAGLWPLIRERSGTHCVAPPHRGTDRATPPISD